MKFSHAVLTGAMLGALVGLGVAWTEDVSTQAGYEAGLADGIKAGKEYKNVELATVFAPYGYHKIRMAKKDCEAKSGMICKIYGGFAPDIKATREEPVKKGPL
jgi:hypothetical protein